MPRYRRQSRRSVPMRPDHLREPQVSWSSRWERERETQEEAMAPRVPQASADAVEAGAKTVFLPALPAQVARASPGPAVTARTAGCSRPVSGASRRANIQGSRTLGGRG